MDRTSHASLTQIGKVHCHPKCRQTRTIRIYCEDRRNVWLCSEDAEWAMRYLRDQLECKGIRIVSDDDTGPGVPMPQPNLQIADAPSAADDEPSVASGN